MRFGWLSFHMEGIPALQALLEKGIPIQAIITLNEEQRSKRSGAAGRAARRTRAIVACILNIQN